jgi:hypothetical protein
VGGKGEAKVGLREGRDRAAKGGSPSINGSQVHLNGNKGALLVEVND